MIATELEPIMRQYPEGRRDALIPMLQAIQQHQGYLSQEAVLLVGRHLGLPASKIYGVATFYNQFRFQPLGRFHIQLCRGTACHVKGSAGLLDAFVRALGVRPGQTTRDGLFSLEVVACIGACGLAPVISVNGEFYAEVTPDKVKKILNAFRRQAKHDQAP